MFRQYLLLECRQQDLGTGPGFRTSQLPVGDCSAAAPDTAVAVAVSKCSAEEHDTADTAAVAAVHYCQLAVPERLEGSQQTRLPLLMCRLVLPANLEDCQLPSCMKTIRPQLFCCFL